MYELAPDVKTLIPLSLTAISSQMADGVDRILNAYRNFLRLRWIDFFQIRAGSDFELNMAWAGHC